MFMCGTASSFLGQRRSLRTCGRSLMCHRRSFVLSATAYRDAAAIGSSLQAIIHDPERTFAKISMEAVGDGVESFKTEISRLIDTPGINGKDFIKDLVGNYLEIQFNCLEGNTMRLPLYRKHTGVFFVPTTEKVYQVHRAVDIEANKGLTSKRCANSLVLSLVTLRSVSPYCSCGATAFCRHRTDCV